MGLSDKKNSFNGDYFITQGTITECTIEYNVASVNDESKVSDVVLKVTMECEKKEGGTYNKYLTIAGNFKRDMRNLVLDWGSAFKIRDFFTILGIKDWETDDMGNFPDWIIKAAIGKSPFALSYRSEKQDGTASYRTYNNIHTNAQKLEELFIKQVASKYPPYKYKPEGSVDDDASLDVSGGIELPF